MVCGGRFKKTGKRKEIFLATKFAIAGDPNRPVNGDPEYVKQCMEKSLARLGGMRLFILMSVVMMCITSIMHSGLRGSILHAPVGSNRNILSLALR